MFKRQVESDQGQIIDCLSQSTFNPYIVSGWVRLVRAFLLDTSSHFFCFGSCFRLGRVLNKKSWIISRSWIVTGQNVRPIPAYQIVWVSFFGGLKRVDRVEGPILKSCQKKFIVMIFGLVLPIIICIYLFFLLIPITSVSLQNETSLGNNQYIGTIMTCQLKGQLKAKQLVYPTGKTTILDKMTKKVK